MPSVHTGTPLKSQRQLGEHPGASVHFPATHTSSATHTDTCERPLLSIGLNTTTLGMKPKPCRVTLYIVMTLAFGVSHSSSKESSVT